MKNILRLLCLASLVSSVDAATRTLADAGGIWTNTSSWVEGYAPASTDDVVVTATSGNVTVTNADGVCKTADFTGYTGTVRIASSRKLTVSGNLTMDGAWQGPGTLSMNAAGTLTSNGKTIPGAFTLTAVKITFADPAIVQGLLTTVGNTQFSNSTVTCLGGLTAGAMIVDTTEIILGGTGTITCDSAFGRSIGNDVTINTTGTYTIASAGLRMGIGKTLKWIAGTLSASGKCVDYGGATGKLQSNGYRWPRLQSYAACTVTLLDNCLVENFTPSQNMTFDGPYSCDLGSLSNTAAMTLVSTNPVTIRDLVPLAGYAVTLDCSAGVSVTNLTMISGCVLKLSAASTMTVTERFNVNGVPGFIPTTIQSATANLASYVIHTGASTNLVVCGTTFTDITSPSGNAIKNWYGDTLTRCTNISNVTVSDLGTAATDIVGVY